MRDLLSRGIGVHHGGLLPLVKEVGYYFSLPGRIRHLFSFRWWKFSLLEGWSKFFSPQRLLQWWVGIFISVVYDPFTVHLQGVNMPAKSVVFSGIRKHDGRNFREILPGEYTQMAGRAGRRGLDPTGTVIIITSDELPEVRPRSNRKFL